MTQVIRSAGDRMLLLLAVLALLGGLFVAEVQNPPKAEAAAGDTIIYHSTQSVRNTMYVCKDWGGGGWGDGYCASGTSKRDLYRGHRTSEWGWADADGVYIPAGYDLMWGNGLVYSEVSHGRWVKIQGCVSTCTKSLWFRE